MKLDTQINVLLGVALIWAFSHGLVLAQERRSPAHKADKAQVSEPKSQPTKHKRKQKRTQKPPRSTETMLADKPKAAPAPQPTAAAAKKAAALDNDDADVHNEGDKSVKALEFTGLDIEGQLKTPQMLFFLNRLRAEFDRPRLPHRSFMPELEASREDKAL